jgi:hypothetical protein
VFNDNTDEHICDLVFDGKEYSAKLYSKGTDLPVMFGFPIAGTTPNPPSSAILDFLENRVIPPNRDYLKEILHQNGIYEYSWQELIKLNKGRTTDDYYRVEVEEVVE